MKFLIGLDADRRATERLAERCEQYLLRNVAADKPDFTIWRKDQLLFSTSPRIRYITILADVGGSDGAAINQGRIIQMARDEWESIIQQIVDESNQELKLPAKRRIIMRWRSKLEKEPPHLPLHQIDEIVREVRRRLEAKKE